MKLVGVLSWYDESPGWLATAVAGFGRVCDEIVAVDGAYALYPGARPASHPQQAEAILSAAEAMGVACTIHRPSKLFYGNQIEKRNLTLKLAGATLSENDWLIIIDADFHIFRLNPERVRAELEATEALLASYTILDGIDYLSDADLSERVAREDYDTEWTCRTENIYRWHPSLLYGPQHWMVSREVDGERQWLRHLSGNAPALDLDNALVAYHRRSDRALVRQQAQESFYRDRELFGVEPEGDGSFPTDHELETA
jgi:hypothetical protein